jgi:spore photoproduct lyase
MPIQKLYVDSADADHPLVRHFSASLNLKPQPLIHPNELFAQIKDSDDPWRSGKQILWLTRNKGAFLKKCPGTRDYVCCGYQILHIGTYCTMDCAYCILQGYFHPPVLQFFINQNDLQVELDQALRGAETMRIGTGEFTDSLIWENATDTTADLIKRFSEQRNAVLELKTKTTAISRLKDIVHCRKTILSWSLNTPNVIRVQERGTASLHARLQAAVEAQSWGYPLAFHFDPMVIYPNAEEEYAQVIRMLFDQIAAENIAWISLGTFRFMPALQPIIKQRFPESNIIYGEFITGLDGKMRYFKPLRIQLYRHMVESIRSLAPEVLVYLCMEDEEVWQKSFGYTPSSRGGLSEMLDAGARACCDLRKQ